MASELPPAPASAVEEPADDKSSLQSLTDKGKKAFALKRYEEACDLYSSALELSDKVYGQNATESADLFLKYGQALLEHAITTSHALGQQEAANGGGQEGSDEAEAALKIATSTASNIKNHFVFGDEGDEEGEEASAEEPSTSTSAAAGEGSEAVAVPTTTTVEESTPNGEAEIEEAPEDDFNAAWEVLDVARSLYSKLAAAASAPVDELRAKYKESDALLMLGDVSLETENFPQAVKDYASCLALKSTMHPKSSRHISEIHYKLGIAHEFSPIENSRASALEHVEAAVESVKLRVEELKSGVSGFKLAPTGSEDGSKGKGKGVAEDTYDPEFVIDSVEKMSEELRASELKELNEFLIDIELKVEELRQAPESATGLVEGLIPTGSSSLSSTATLPSTAPVNDLTSMVKKKAPAEKRKVEEVAEVKSENGSKKAKVEDA